MAGDQLNLADDRGDGGLELVVENDDFVGATGLGSDVLSNSHNHGEVVGGLDLRDSHFEQIGEGSSQGEGSFFSDGEDFHLGTVLGTDVGTDVSEDTGVSGTAETFIGGDRHEELTGDGGHIRGPSLHVGITLHHHVDGVEAELLSIGETLQVTAHLGSGNHLHSLGNLTNVSDGFDSEHEGLLRHGEITLREGHEQLRLVLQKLGLGHATTDRPLELGSEHFILLLLIIQLVLINNGIIRR